MSHGAAIPLKTLYTAFPHEMHWAERIKNSCGAEPPPNAGLNEAGGVDRALWIVNAWEVVRRHPEASAMQVAVGKLGPS